MSLAIHQTIDKLKTFADSPSPILSIYIDLQEHGSRNPSEMLNTFNELISFSLSDEQQTEFANNLNYMRGYIQENSQAHTSLAIFSGGDNLWEVIPLDEHISSSVVISHSPNLIPLLDILRKQQRYLIILVDQAKAIYFTLIDNALEDKGSVYDPSVHKKVKGGHGGEFSDKTTNRFHEELKKHMDLIAHNIDSFIKDKVVIGVLIGRHKSTMQYLKNYLPERLQQKILGYFVTELNIPFDTILTVSRQQLDAIHIRDLQK